MGLCFADDGPEAIKSYLSNTTYPCLQTENGREKDSVVGDK
jgi:hypothetical protein